MPDTEFDIAAFFSIVAMMLNDKVPFGNLCAHFSPDGMIRAEEAIGCDPQYQMAGLFCGIHYVVDLPHGKQGGCVVMADARSAVTNG